MLEMKRVWEVGHGAVIHQLCDLKNLFELQLLMTHDETESLECTQLTWQLHFRISGLAKHLHGCRENCV